MYDAPYRLEQDGHVGDLINYVIMRTGEGIICHGTNFSHMRRLVECANELAQQEDRGR